MSSYWYIAYQFSFNIVGVIKMANKIKNNIRQFRFENNQMTQAELADKAGVTRQTIIAIEAGQYNPSLELAIRISKVFGKKVDDVMEQEFSGEDCIKEKLMELQLQFELDEISQEDYEKKEMELLARLESIRKSEQEG